MINPLTNSPQITASGSFLLGNTGRCSGSYLIGQGSLLQLKLKNGLMLFFKLKLAFNDSNQWHLRDFDDSG
jgi:hypothetical protein